ncbi:hypothetical protein NQ317_006923 [Molorchus minor]|uniref:Uncharacterized protein n=1 Tax=Molorchus minor TaxID=1323400 RepID=A0ABQ9ISA7_9CUCU|nr:hypothetical protein NQ317_006923 [Molorchus minor]
MSRGRTGISRYVSLASHIPIVLCGQHSGETGAPQREMPGPNFRGGHGPDQSTERGAKKRAWRTRDPADRRVYNQYTRLVREELDSLRQERWNSYLSELDPADPGLWKTQKILRTARRPIPPIHGERGLVYTKQDKAEAFADSLEMQMHIESTVAKGKACFRKLYPMIGRDSQLDLRNKLLLIRQVIQSQLTYAATAWGYAANTYQKKLQAVENVALRCAVNAPQIRQKRRHHPRPPIHHHYRHDQGQSHETLRQAPARQSLSYRGLNSRTTLSILPPPTLQRGYAPEQSQTDIKTLRHWSDLRSLQTDNPRGETSRRRKKTDVRRAPEDKGPVAGGANIARIKGEPPTHKAVGCADRPRGKWLHLRIGYPGLHR